MYVVPRNSSTLSIRPVSRFRRSREALQVGAERRNNDVYRRGRHVTSSGVARTNRNVGHRNSHVRRKRSSIEISCAQRGWFVELAGLHRQSVITTSVNIALDQKERKEVEGSYLFPVTDGTHPFLRLCVEDHKTLSVDKIVVTRGKRRSDIAYSEVCLQSEAFLLPARAPPRATTRPPLINVHPACWCS